MLRKRRKDVGMHNQVVRELTAWPSCGYASITDRRSLMALDLEVAGGGVHVTKTQLLELGLHPSKAFAAKAGEPTTNPATKP